MSIDSRHDRRSTSRMALATIVLLWLAATASAQNPSSGNVFVGYSFMGANLFSGGHANLNGWSASAEKKFLPFVGAVADFSGNYGSHNFPVACADNTQVQCLVSGSVAEHCFQAGLRGSYAVATIKPFIEILLGAEHASESVGGLSSSKTALAETFAVGLDCRLTRLLAWRLEADWIKTGSFYSQQNSVRASTGLVIRF